MRASRIARAMRASVHRRMSLRSTRLGAPLALALVAAACGSRPEAGFLSPVPELHAGAATHTILVATTRKRNERVGTLFNGERAERLDFARIAVSVPPNHEAGQIE